MIAGVGDREVQLAASTLERLAGLRFDGSADARLRQAIADVAADRATTAADLVADLHGPTGALEAVLDRVTVQLSAFFREPEQIHALVEVALPQLPPGPVELWCAGCANGQEAYSLALALDAAGDRRVSIVATDVSRPALARAAAGTYRDDEVAGVPAHLRHRFERAGGNRPWSVDDRARARVRFQRHNLVRDALPVGAACQVVFCRNVLIYLGRPDVVGLCDRIAALLRPSGWLFLGAAESIWATTDRFRLQRCGLLDGGTAFAHRPVADLLAPQPSPRQRPATGRPQRSAPPTPRASAPAMSGPTPGGPLQRGELALAAGDAAGAAAWFRQAAFLDPDDPIAHLHLALALDALGDHGPAARAYAASTSALARVDEAAIASQLEGFDVGALRTLLSDKMARAAGARPPAER